ncbi:spore coat protein, CotS family [Clostridium sp. DSM 8431]|uniref:CotS family spore coat protein n=1 Tax=Clostridium sp. DSM 8431 TaxID=1761781 RepID=UPI0008F3205A|nr:CotS family spore coat protein [Clostridium sp. DSM 8431]SFU77067.1 spore coat protein, CotS family [Clostridium sp. DSM 8431]
MNKPRYSEKRYLSNYELSLDFFNEAGIKVNDITPLRKVFLLNTDEGNKILKRVDYGENRLKFVNNIVDEIRKEDKNVMSFYKFPDGKTYKLWKGSYYVIMDLIDGREASFTNPIEVNMCAESLANMHMASKKVVKNSNLENKLDISFSEKVKNSLYELKEIKKLIGLYKFRNEFDEIFYKNIDTYIEEVNNVNEEIKNIKYEEYRDSLKNVVICHNDLAQHNFIYNNNNMYLIDFDYSSVDLRVMDIADIILKGIKNAAFDVYKSIELVKSYDKVYKIDDYEYKLIYILLSYPRDILTLGRSYYFKQKNWDYDVFLNRLNMKIENDNFRKVFLKKFKEKLI